MVEPDILNAKSSAETVTRRRPPLSNSSGFKRDVTFYTLYGAEKLQLTIWEFSDGSPCEIIIGAKKSGALVDSFLKEVGANYSRMLQLGMPLDELTRSIIATHGPLSGQTDHAYIKSCLGVQDFLGKLLRYEYFGETGFLSVKPDPNDETYEPTRRELWHGKVSPQSSGPSPSNVTEEESSADVQLVPSAVDKTHQRKEVFVVHGRNYVARSAMFQFLRSIGLTPLEWNQAVLRTKSASPYVGDILNAALSQAQAIVVLLTGDDEGVLRADLRNPDDPLYEVETTPQPRLNVVFEAGLAMGRNEARTVLVQIGKQRPFSDIAGRHVIRLDNTSARRQELAQRLNLAGCPIDLSGTDWHTAGNF